MYSTYQTVLQEYHAIVSASPGRLMREGKTNEPHLAYFNVLSRWPEIETRE